MLENLIELLTYIFFGALQGITETLPISSSGHILIFSDLFNLKQDNSLLFAVLLHTGSLIAILIFYRKTIIELIKHFFIYLFKKDGRTEVVKDDFKFVWLLVIATIPAALAGYLFEDYIEEHLTSLLTVGIALIVTSIILFTISRMPKGNKQKKDITLTDAIFVGLTQAFAITPGLSRSGTTVSASLYRKIDIDNSLRFSFLLFLPIALGSTLLSIVDFIKSNEALTLLVPYLIACLTAILFTYIALHIFIDIIKKGKLSYFSIYCLLAGITSIMLFIF